MSNYYPTQPHSQTGRPGRAPSLPSQLLQQPSSRLEQPSISSFGHHHRYPSAPSGPTKYLHNQPSTLHDSGYDGASDKSCHTSDEHLSQDPFIHRPLANPGAQYSNDYLPGRTGPGPPARFQDIIETCAQHDVSPHSSLSGHSKISSNSRSFLPTRLRTSSNSSTSIDRFQMDRITPPRGEINGTLSPRLRSSDDGGSSLSNSISNTTSKALKKRSGLSSFFNGVLGTPRSKMEISAPSNPTHLCHVGFNNVTGEFTVSPSVDSERAQNALSLQFGLSRVFNESSADLTNLRVSLNHGRKHF